MRTKDKEYLKELSSLETPEMDEGPWANDTYEDICVAYVNVRNYSKDCLGEKTFTPERRTTLDKLLVKTEELKSLKL